MKLHTTPALRPSLPAMCRKRPFCQGQALRAAYAGLDMHGRASGPKCLRVTDVDASGGGSVNGYIISKCQKAKKTERQNTFSHCNARCPQIQFASAPCTFQFQSEYLPRSRNHAAYSIAASYTRAAKILFLFTIPPLRGILPGHSPADCSEPAGCGQSANPMPIPCEHDACSMRFAYRQNTWRVPVSNLPDADFSHTGFRKYTVPFVRRYFRRPAYVSSIRCAYSLTAGEGLCPFEPQKAQRRERQ